MNKKEEYQYVASNGIELTYMEDPYPVQNYIGKQKLLIIFQSLGDEKSDDLKKRYPYTLIDGLRFFNCRKIYIKDNQGLVGNYYLGLDGKFDNKVAVLEFLEAKIVEYGVVKENIITFGFSKGGYAALMFGFELGVNHIITAVPQYDLRCWIDKYKPFLKYMLPKDITEEVKSYYSHYLDGIISKSPNKPNVYIVTSHHDNTYDDHIPFLLSTLDSKKIRYYIYHNDEFVVTRHNNVVVNSLNEILTILGSVLSPPSVKEMFNLK